MAEEAAPDPHYFLSYSRSDEAFALKLATDLRSRGIQIWVDQLDIRPSEHWDRAIERAVKECRGIIVILSPRSVASENVADEISFAIDSGKTVLPVMIEQCTLPLRITRMQVIDGTRNYGNALEQCASHLRSGEQLKDKRSGSAPAATSLDQGSIIEAKKKLTMFVGPIASMFVDKAALRATSSAELYRFLSLHIEDSVERQRFLASAPSETSNPAPGLKNEEAGETISSEKLDQLSKLLMPYLGPVSPLLVRCESKGCGSVDELEQRVAALIPTQEERSKFMATLHLA